MHPNVDTTLQDTRRYDALLSTAANQDAQAVNRTLAECLDGKAVDELEILEYDAEREAIAHIVMLAADQAEHGKRKPEEFQRAAMQLLQATLERCDAAYWERVDNARRAARIAQIRRAA